MREIDSGKKLTDIVIFEYYSKLTVMRGVEHRMSFKDTHFKPMISANKMV